MTNASKLILASGLLFAIGMPSLAQASPTSTPAANAVPMGKGAHLGGLFDSMIGGRKSDDAKSDGERRTPRKQLNSREWHEAYRARHGHDLPSPLDRPGGH